MIPTERFVVLIVLATMLAVAVPPVAANPAASDGTDAATEVRLTSPSGAQTSAVAISPADTDRLVASANVPDGPCIHYSHDGGSSWTPVALPLLVGACSGPTVDWSPDGQFTYTATIDGCGEGCRIFFYRSDDGGVTWTSLETETPGEPRREVATGASEGFLHVDRSPASSYEGNVYLGYRDFDGTVHLARSTDFGDRWSDRAFSRDPRGAGGDVTTDRSGNLYRVWPGSGTQGVFVSISTNGGASFDDAVEVASRNTLGSLPIPILTYDGVPNRVFADADTGNGPYADSVYLVWVDGTGPVSPDPALNHARIQVARSRDGGETWAISTPHETADSIEVDRWQPALAVGDNGVVHVVFHDTRRSGDRLSADVFYSYSIDGAETWSAPTRVTGAISPKIDDWREFGEYSGLDTVQEELVAVYTDNRHETGGTGDSVDIYAAALTPGGGAAGAGHVPGARGVAGPPLTLARLETGELQLEWSPACGPGDDYAVYEGTLGLFDDKNLVQCSTAGATTTILAPPAGSVFYLVVATSGGATEGSYGRGSDGLERPPSQNACFPQAVGTCP